MRFSSVRLLLLFSFVASVPACAAYKSALVPGVPAVRQKPDFCGEACAEMYLRKLGHKLTQDQVFNISGLDPNLGRGCYTAELNAALGRIGFQTGKVWFPVNQARKTELEAQWQALHADLVQGVPSIVCMHYDEQPGTTEHFRLVLGYDSAADEVIYNEPAEERGAYRRVARDKFLKLWPLATGDDSATVIRMRLDAATINASPAAAGSFSNADYAQHIMKLRETLPKSFYATVQAPFVVVGDDPPHVVKQFAVSTVHWAQARLKADFFKRDPADILDIWLFKDDKSYRSNVAKIFGDTPSTPYGYYSPEHKALIMNIDTGGGTLVHEIVHPFMAANFPACPPWFNEGMGSLYEQCGEKDGHIVGYTNWRLPGLQEDLKAGTVPAFKTLMEMDEDEFYNRDRGSNYGQSRYLCYYLQEKGLLRKYYAEFVANSKDDPSGYKTLQKILATDDIPAFQKKWAQYVLGLKFGT